MGSFADELAADLAAAIGGYEQTFVWGGETYPAVRTTDAAALTLRPGGGGFLEDDITERITTPLPLNSVDGFPVPNGSAPAVGDLVDGYALQVKKIDPNVGQIVLWVGPPDGSAHE